MSQTLLTYNKNALAACAFILPELRIDVVIMPLWNLVPVSAMQLAKLWRGMSWCRLLVHGVVLTQMLLDKGLDDLGIGYMSELHALVKQVASGMSLKVA